MFSDLLFRLRAFFHRKALESELDEELRAHVESETAKISRQVSPLKKPPAARACPSAASSRPKNNAEKPAAPGG
jgi:hypothetical protein